jgi:hypothetical protein
MAVVEATTVILTLEGGVDIMGAMVEDGEGMFVLRAARVAEERQGRTEWTELEGETVVPKGRVMYWQRALDPRLIAAALHLASEEAQDGG